MSISQDMAWFKGNFGTRVLDAVKGTPFTLDLIAAIAYQETGKEIWGPLSRRGLPVEEILKLCTGDTLDFPKRSSAWPKDRAQLESHPKGTQMFAIARAALEAMAKKVTAYQPVLSNKNKFCHGYGIFQYDIQFFKSVDPDYFLNRDYEVFEKSLGKCLSELKVKKTRIGLDGRPILSDAELCAVAIAYNTGGYDPAKGLKQGHAVKLADGSKKYYGQFIAEYIKAARAVTFSPPVITPNTPVPPPSAVTATGKTYRVETMSDPLSLRRTAKKPAAGEPDNKFAALPRHSLVRAISDVPVNGFLEVEASIQGAVKRGFASASLLKAVPTPAVVPAVVTPTPAAPVAVPSRPVTVSGSVLPEVHLKRKAGAVTRRTNLPNQGGAYPLSEAGMPSRGHGSAATRCAEIAAIIAYLDSENPAHLRYKPAGPTYCNLYAHDFCTLAGAYLPRVWWTSKAIERLRAGEKVEPSYLATVDEMRANALFRWLTDYGSDYGWRQTGTLTKLQDVANAGGLGIICGRNTVEGRSGHIVMVVPETATQKAKRNAAGEVTSPLQSQAGRVNFRYGTSKPNWWLGADFAASGFWVHD
ncbi:hypothetical protein [Sphingopyxis sp. KK2]|uniref:hypothetical protein n=1 Tax=Sphingopyxis sp. KK2 TaxID=1855727 RepID=UPI00097E6677|nr:hypothetical protein [Sphingopyxis sp. KK2]